jgi:hypothetical protein
MEPITTAIIAAVSVGAVDGLKDTAKVAISDAYAGFKRLILSKKGMNSPVVKAIQDIEEKPSSSGRRQTLDEEIKEANIGNDKEILHAIKTLKKVMENNIPLNINAFQVNGTGAVGLISGEVNEINNGIKESSIKSYGSNATNVIGNYIKR